MSRKTIPAEEIFERWRKDPDYVAAYDGLAGEFALASALIEARSRAGLTQEQLAKRMRTTQAVIARLESGRVMPSTRTLERFAAATGTKLRIAFEPARRENSARVHDKGCREGVRCASCQPAAQLGRAELRGSWVYSE
jgi:transcriptional regulator with XRE-family HTH domain